MEGVSGCVLGGWEEGRMAEDLGALAAVAKGLTMAMLL